MNWEEIGDTFIDEVFRQIMRNRVKWRKSDPRKTKADFVLIAQEQLGQLAKILLDELFLDLPHTAERECIHTIAMLYEVWERCRYSISVEERKLLASALERFVD